jgi:flagellar basal-body rod protein FlgG
MRRIVRGSGPMVAFLLVASVLVGADGPGQTRKKEPAPAAAKQDKPLVLPSLVAPPTAQPPADFRVVKSEVTAEAMLGDALKATEQARQIVVANLANVNTPGYKRQIASFSAVLAGPTPTVEELAKTEALDSARRSSVAMSGPHTDLRPGKIRRTGRPLDLAIDGQGFFEVAPADDAKIRGTYCTRCGRFELDTHGKIILRGLKRDWVVIPMARVDDPVTKIEITSDGLIYATVNESRCMIGQVQLHALPADCTFTPCGDSVYLVHFNGRRHGYMRGNPGIESLGELRPSCLEDSNVDPQQELEELQQLQRQAGALEQAAQLLHPGPKLAAGTPERSAR